MSQAEKKILSANDNKEYLPIEGLDAFRKATVDLLLGEGATATAEVSQRFGCADSARG